MPVAGKTGSYRATLMSKPLTSDPSAMVVAGKTGSYNPNASFAGVYGRRNASATAR